MPNDGGGNWNRAARKSGGARMIPAVGAVNVSFNEWRKIVDDLIRHSVTWGASRVVGDTQLLKWYEAGERTTWVAVQVINTFKAFRNSKES